MAGRTPEYNVNKLPKWAQAHIEKLELEVNDLLCTVDNMEYQLEHMAKQLESKVEIAPGTTLSTVDL